MTNTAFFSAMALLLSLTLGSWHNSVLAKTQAPDPDPDEHERAHICSEMCDSIRRHCAGDIAEGNVAGRDLKEGILNEASCQLMCEADWTDKTFNCVSAADHCSQFLDEAPYCMETEDDGAQPPPITPAENASCDAACRKYAQCAGYGEGTPAEIQEAKTSAHASCMQICPTWSAATRACINRHPIHSPADCYEQTQCVMGWMQGMQDKVPSRRKK